MARLIARFFVAVLYSIGPLLLVIAIVSSVPKAEFVRSSIAADGTIVDLQRVYLPRRSKDVYLPVFRFTANDGQTYRIRAESNASFIPFKPGDRVRILYVQGHPETARISSIPQLWMPQIILGLLGGLLCTFSAKIIFGKRAAYRATPMAV